MPDACKKTGWFRLRSTTGFYKITTKKAAVRENSGFLILFTLLLHHLVGGVLLQIRVFHWNEVGFAHVAGYHINEQTGET
jgi:hypothetical protein